jgi:ribose transport system substrate-binding protein
VARGSCADILEEEDMRPGSIFATSLLAFLMLGACIAGPALAAGDAVANCKLSTLPSPDAASNEAAGAAASVDTSAFKKDGTVKLGVSAGYLANSWVVFALQLVKYEAAKDSRFATEIRVTDAGFNANKQISDIHDLINSGVDAIIYWPVDDKAIEPALEDAVQKHIPTVNIGGGYSNSPGVTSNAYIDQYILGRMVAENLMAEIKGKGSILSLLPIAGTTAAVDQDRALKDVLGVCPDVHLLDTENGDWNRAKSQTIAQNWAQRFPQVDGLFSPAGQMSIGAAQAFDQAGILDRITFSPSDEYNGWLKWAVQHPKKNSGVVTFPPEAGAVGVNLMAKIVRGEPVSKGVRVPSVYIPADQVKSYAQMEMPDDWWATQLPAKWQPSH